MPPLPALDHRRGRGMSEAHERDHVEIDLTHLGVDVERVERPERAEARVVHQHVDGPDARLDRGQLVGIGEVGDEHLGVRRAGTASISLASASSARGIARDEHEVVTARRQLPRELLADSRPTRP